MAVISFKNVGIKKFETENELLNRSLKPIGIKTPVEYGRQGEGIFHMHYDLRDQIADNLKNLILTNHGERLGMYDLGANLRPLLTEFSNKDDFDAEAMVRINTAVSKFMPFLTLVGFDSTPEYEDNRFVGKISILLIYSIPDLNVFDRRLNVVLSII
jgi:hypothetical protein